MRQINEVIEKMIQEVLPLVDNSMTKSHVKSRLESVLSSVSFAAPEMTNFWWGELGKQVSYMVENKPYNELNVWELRLVDILLNKE